MGRRRSKRRTAADDELTRLRREIAEAKRAAEQAMADVEAARGGHSAASQRVAAAAVARDEAQRMATAALQGVRLADGALALGRAPVPQYGERAYWEARYEREREQDASFEWYEGYDVLRPAVRAAVPFPEASRVLVVGCGNSSLCEDLMRDGFMAAVGVDFAPAVVAQMRARPGRRADYREMDARDLDFEDGAFDAAVDKGTLDAVLSAAEGGLRAARQILAETMRVLAVGGRFLVVSSVPPALALPLLAEFSGDVQTREVEARYSSGAVLTVYAVCKQDDRQALEDVERVRRSVRQMRADAQDHREQLAEDVRCAERELGDAERLKAALGRDVDEAAAGMRAGIAEAEARQQAELRAMEAYAQGRGVEHREQDAGGYRWSQGADDVTVLVPLPAGTRARDVACEITAAALSVGVRGREPAVEGMLAGRVRVADCVWGVDAATGCVDVTLAKAAPGELWERVLHGDRGVREEDVEDYRAAMDALRPAPAEVPPPPADDRACALSYDFAGDEVPPGAPLRVRWRLEGGALGHWKDLVAVYDAAAPFPALEARWDSAFLEEPPSEPEWPYEQDPYPSSGGVDLVAPVDEGAYVVVFTNEAGVEVARGAPFMVCATAGVSGSAVVSSTAGEPAAVEPPPVAPPTPPAAESAVAPPEPAAAVEPPPVAERYTLELLPHIGCLLLTLPGTTTPRDVQAKVLGDRLELVCDGRPPLRVALGRRAAGAAHCRAYADHLSVRVPVERTDEEAEEEEEEDDDRWRGDAQREADAIAAHGIACRFCGAALLAAAAVRRALPMPSSNWSEISDHWLCHGDSSWVTDRLRRVGRPEPGMVLVGEAFVRVRAEPAVAGALRRGGPSLGAVPAADDAQGGDDDDQGDDESAVQVAPGAAPVVCRRCAQPVGALEQARGSVCFAKHRVRAGAALDGFSAATVVAQRAVIAGRGGASRRLIVTADGEPAVALQLVSWDTRLRTQAEPELAPVVKVAFRACWPVATRAEVGEVAAWAVRHDAEPVDLAWDECEELMEQLRGSSAQVPPSARVLGELRVGWLS